MAGNYMFLFGLAVFSSSLGGLAVALVHALRRSRDKGMFDDRDRFGAPKRAAKAAGQAVEGWAVVRGSGR